MKRCFLLVLLFFGGFFTAFAQKILSPEAFLGYKLGEQFTPYYRVADYFKYIALQTKTVKLFEYGKTYEGRPLLVSFISSEDNTDRLEEIRKNNLILTGLEKGKIVADYPVIVWLSYNVHGNEAASSESAMQTLFALTDPANIKTKEWLKNTVVVIDPCLNPDGRERYVNFYNSVKSVIPDPASFTREHIEPWPGGRSNHYYFDLNRDWAWQTQLETQQRLLIYNQWLPQIHVDFHEQGINEAYFFSPAAEPYHENITKWQRAFQKVIGKNNARYFDEHNWTYFTRERFDLLYPSYGDTYPTYNGAIGMTFEQGGSHRAGLSVITASGDTLTLKDRIEHHFITALSTIEVASQNADRLISEFGKYFSSAQKNPPGKYKTYVVKGENAEKIRSLALLLKRNGILFEYGSPKNASGYNYFTNKKERFSIQKEDLIVSAYQPKTVLVKVLFEPKTFVADSNTYDITAWALPYVYGLKSYALTEIIKSKTSFAPVSPQPENAAVSSPVAFVANWNSTSDVKFLIKLLNKKVNIKFSETPFEVGGQQFNAGSLIITKSGNKNLGNNFDKAISLLAKESGITLKRIASGMVDKGADLGSQKIHSIKKPKVAIVSGDGISSLELGEVWHFFEQELQYPLSVINLEDLNFINLSNFDVILLPGGGYTESNAENIQKWIADGGKLIAMGDAVAKLAAKKTFQIKLKEADTVKVSKKHDPYESLKIFESRERDYLKASVPGAIYKVALDNTHPLAFGYPDFYFTLKLDDRLYQFLDKGWNVGVLKKNNYVAGFVGENVKNRLHDGLIFGVEEFGKGSLIYLVDDPLFRGFWENGKLLLCNAIFMAGQ